MKKFVLSLATLAALSTSAMALTNAEFNELERPENKTLYGPLSYPMNGMNGEVTSVEGFAVTPASSENSLSGSSYQKQQRFIMMENPEHY